MQCDVSQDDGDNSEGDIAEGPVEGHVDAQVSQSDHGHACADDHTAGAHDQKRPKVAHGGGHQRDIRAFFKGRQ